MRQKVVGGCTIYRETDRRLIFPKVLRDLPKMTLSLDDKEKAKHTSKQRLSQR